MLRRANDLIGRARERIRIAAEHDPHAWHDSAGHHRGGPDDEAFEDEYDDEGPEYDDLEDDDLGQEAPAGDRQNGSSRPPLGSPEPGAQDVDGVSPNGVSGPPAGGRRRTAGERGRRQRRSDLRAG